MFFDSPTMTQYPGNFRPVAISSTDELINNPAKADELRDAFNAHVVNDGHWKGRCVAVVPEDQADLVADAMVFIGAIPDAIVRCEPFEGQFLNIVLTPRIEVPGKPGHVAIHSRGYWAHGF